MHKDQTETTAAGEHIPLHSHTFWVILLKITAIIAIHSVAITECPVHFCAGCMQHTFEQEVVAGTLEVITAYIWYGAELQA